MTLFETSHCAALCSIVTMCLVGCGGAPASTPPPSRACTDIGCSDGLRVELAPATGSWAPGSYVFAIVTPTGTTTCEGALPLPACETGRAFRCAGPPVLITESGCALPAEAHGFSTLELAAGPPAVTITISKDGVELVRRELAPSYQTTSPNGPGCEPTCRQASETLRW